MKKTLFIKNALILTVTSLILRFIGIIFKIWLAKKIGSEGMGLYQLVFSVYVLASTFATSGTSTAVTRLVSEELVLGNKKSTLKILKRAIQISLIIAFISIAILFVFSEFIGSTLLGDLRTVPALKILPVSLPFIGITSCLRGYFIARRKITPNAVTQIFEQIIRIAIIFGLIKKFHSHGLAACCFAVIAGDAIAEILSCVYLYLLFLFDKKHLNSLTVRHSVSHIVKKILHISVPITSGRYLNSLLRTAENILVPKNLAKFPANSKNALSQFGSIKGMALPILFFPSGILNAISTLLIPEISEAVARKQPHIVKNSCEKIINLTCVIGIIFGAVFFAYGKEIGELIYRDYQIGILLKALSPIVPLMYLDSICDGILKGLDQQSFSFKTTISDSVIRIFLILLLLPKTGLNGFIMIMYFSNFLTCFLNVKRLVKISKAKIDFKNICFLPVISALTVVLIYRFLLMYIPFLGNFTNIVIFCILSCGTYILIILRLKIIKKEDFIR